MPSTTFQVDARPDKGDFLSGDNAGLAWDILHRTATHDYPSIIDLSKCVHLKPYSIACLCALGAKAAFEQTQIQAIPPSDNRCSDHLSRLGIEKFINGDWGDTLQRDTNYTAEQFVEPDWNFGEKVIDFLSQQLDVPFNLKLEMKSSIDELLMNVFTHANSPIGGILVGQAFPRTNAIDIAIVDLGQTIKGHLTQNSQHKHICTDSAAILEACLDGVTGTPKGQKNQLNETNSGAGLHFVKSYCETGLGELTILSGSSWITFTKHSNPTIGAIKEPFFKGTLVNIRFYSEISLPNEDIKAIL